VFTFQSHLGSIGGSQIEQDYKLVENEGLFQEYLEMGKKKTKEKQIENKQYICFSPPIWFHNNLCGGLSSCSAVCLTE
jgi:hypothetical protein